MSELLDRIDMLRERKGIKRTPLALQLGLPSSSFTDWGNGKGSPSLKAVMLFAEYFDVSLDYLVYGREHQNGNVLEFSNPEDDALLEAFHRLPPDLRMKAVGYIEGMLSATQPSASAEDAAKLSS